MKKLFFTFFVIALATSKIVAQGAYGSKVDSITGGLGLNKEKLEQLQEYVHDDDIINNEKISDAEKKNKLNDIEAQIKKLLTAEEYQKFVENRKKVKQK